MMLNSDLGRAAAAAADEWGPADDPNREDFIQGFFDGAHGERSRSTYASVEETAAYLSGVIAGQDHPKT